MVIKMIKENCFAYRRVPKKEPDCKALNKLYCENENCKFYKPIKGDSNNEKI